VKSAIYDCVVLLVLTPRTGIRDVYPPLGLWVGDQPTTSGTVKHTSLFTQLSDDPRAINQLKLENAWQSLAYSPRGAIVSPHSEYL